jgi:tRNA threonylcarbamoyladenosine biosynthesis protein TsaE
MEIHHLDLYRFQAPTDWIDAGLDDLINDRSILLIEWPEQGGHFVPAPDLKITLAMCDAGRLATLSACSPRAQKGLDSLGMAADNSANSAISANRDLGP